MAMQGNDQRAGTELDTDRQMTLAFLDSQRARTIVNQFRRFPRKISFNVCGPEQQAKVPILARIHQHAGEWPSRLSWRRSGCIRSLVVVPRARKSSVGHFVSLK